MTVDSMDSDVDDYIFPVTPNSKHSHHLTSAGVGSPTPSHSTLDENYTNELEIHHRPPSVDEDHGGNRSLGGPVQVNDDGLVDHDRPINDHKSQPNIIESQKDKTALLKHMEALSPKAKCIVVSYKEAVHECKHIHFFSTLWKHEEIKRLDNLYNTICEDLECDLAVAEEECWFLFNILPDHPNVQHLNVLCEDKKKSLTQADAELKLWSNVVTDLIPVEWYDISWPLHYGSDFPDIGQVTNHPAATARPQHYFPDLNQFLQNDPQPILSMDGVLILPPGVEEDDILPLGVAPLPPLQDTLKDSSTGTQDGGLTMPSSCKLEGAPIDVCSFVDPDTRKMMVTNALVATVLQYCRGVSTASNDAFARQWASENESDLYKDLVERSNSIMPTCKWIARTKVQQGYKLRPSVWSNLSEPDHQDENEDENENEGIHLYAFEHEVIWDMVLDTISELQCQEYLTAAMLDNIFCSAAATTYCALKERARNGEPSSIDFMVTDFQATYNSLKAQITDYISADTVLLI
ncbi:uncharacterized protein EDB93DRAFT_1100793 [Suillus bovinus]|uniref:uncharacterized protein n=1 Tax=Suillus bovinus TaxID=48563 RepID=UPI001B8782E0|nr:uncharacterized protein EDB93DRAFT_1100793 [Suillus bovinus]KAG2157993.1 hypothetical protein EDB93DRAFT_1100793 [Suillus bovinus]